MGLADDEYVLEKVLEHGRDRPVTFIEEPHAESLFCPIISADDHSLEPGDLFEKRVPARFVDRAPRLVTGPDGAPWWQVDDQQIPILMLNGASGRAMQEWSLSSQTYDEMRLGVWDSKARLLDMDLTGVWSSLCFGSAIWGFAGTRFSKMRDPEVGLACLQAYNDWVVDEWCAANPERFIACQLPWLRDPEQAAAEIYRNAARGIHAVSFSENPEGLGFPNVYSESWNPFFRACEETGTVVNLHVGSSGSIRIPTSSSHEAVGTALFPMSGIEALVDWVYSGVPIRFPELTIALSEAGISWVPMALERLKRAYRQASAIGKGWPSDAPTPMELAQRNFVFTSIEDPSGFQMLDLIGASRVMVETDYPHYDSTWPRCQDMIRGELQHLPAEIVRQVCYENAVRIYRCTPPPRAMVESSEVGAPALAG
jgi:predicted TIM-barrel fold metal-dependent hydrolase